MADKREDIKKEVPEVTPDKPEQTPEEGASDEAAKEGKRFKINKLAVTLGITCVILVVTLACTLYGLFMFKNETKRLSTDLDLCKRGAFSGMIGQD